MNKSCANHSYFPAPYPHYDELLAQDYWRVPLRITDNNYLVYLNENLKRIFTADTLPSFIKLALAFIKASAINKPIYDSELYELDLFIPEDMNNELSKVTGWRASESWFILILSNQQLNELAGYSNET